MLCAKGGTVCTDGKGPRSRRAVLRVGSTSKLPGTPWLSSDLLLSPPTAEFISKQLQGARLSSTPLFTLFIQVSVVLLLWL